MARFARTQRQKMFGQMRKQLDVENYGLDARDLLARCRSKADLCDYHSSQSKNLVTIILLYLGWYHLPHKIKLIKDNSLLVLAGINYLIPISLVHPNEIRK